MDKLTLQRIVLTRDIQAFNDEFDDFNRDCAFLSDAFIELVNTEIHQADSTLVGLSVFSQWVKSRTRKLNQDIRDIQSKSNTILGDCPDHR